MAVPTLQARVQMIGDPRIFLGILPIHPSFAKWPLTSFTPQHPLLRVDNEAEVGTTTQNEVYTIALKIKRPHCGVMHR